jgi:tripartite-type tricarboxylate transporter receptor subunit TctC
MAASSVCGQSFPDKPIRLVTELAAGTGGDAFVRQMVPLVSANLAQPLVVDNRAGAGGLVAAEAVARATPDGYTLLAATQNALVMRRFLSKTRGVDVFTELAAIIEVWHATTVIVAGPAVPAKSLRELIDYAKANPGKLSYGTSGFGTSHHFTGEEIQQLAGIRLTHVPYKGGVGSMQGAAAGEVDIAIGFGATALPVIRSGKVRPLALVVGRRLGNIADLPSASDVIPGFEPPPSWLAVFAPVGVPAARLDVLRSAIAKALQSPELRTRASEDGLELVGTPPGEFMASLRKQTELIGRIAKAAKIQPSEH